MQRSLWALILMVKRPRDSCYLLICMLFSALLTHQPHTNVQTLASWSAAAHFWHLLGISSPLAPSYQVQIQNLTLGGVYGRHSTNPECMKSRNSPSFSSQTEPCLVAWVLRGHPLLNLPDNAVYRVQTTSDSCVFLHHCADGACKGVFIEGCFLRPWSPMPCTPAPGLNGNHAQAPVLPWCWGIELLTVNTSCWAGVRPFPSQPLPRVSSPNTNRARRLWVLHTAGKGSG